MASKKRERSESGFYHVCQRGVNHFDIFEDDDDRSFYKERLRRYAAATGSEVHAWCLMDNHVHLLVRASLDQLSALMRMLGSVYARRFNSRHGRTGPLFEGRFLSVCVETDAQLVAVVRYIHRNPIRHGGRALCGDYAWSSYGEYVGGGRGVCRAGFVMGVFGGMREFVRIHEEERDGERHLDVDAAGSMGDEEARALADRALAGLGFAVPASRIGALPRELRARAIAAVREAVGCPIRQIQRLTAVAYSFVRGAAGAAAPPGAGAGPCLLVAGAGRPLAPPDPEPAG